MEEKKAERRRCSASEAAMRKLSARMRTEQEIRDILKRAAYDDEEIEAAIAELVGYGYLNDERYCGEYFRYAKLKGRADRRIVQELTAKGISAELARSIIEDPRAAELAGLGYDGSVIYDILGKLRQDERDRREAER